jgi:hypothetical protein
VVGHDENVTVTVLQQQAVIAKLIMNLMLPSKPGR